MKPPTPFEAILLAELNLGLPPMSFYKLMKEPDDWSFVLKLHAILESALTRLLEKRLHDDGFDAYTNFVGKAQLAFELQEVALDKEYQGFYFALNSLRNLFAHNAKYICADLRTVLLSIPHAKRRSVPQRLGLSFVEHGPERGLNRSTTPCDLDEATLKSLRDNCVSLYPRYKLLMSAGNALVTLSLAYYIQLGKDGKFYAQEFRPQLQDLLNDPAVLDFRKWY